ncbi:MAG: RNase adapter RapZ [Anaerovoracaceae bacterium]|jgi:UPF0042 nucleotide-binding protein
MEIIIVTGLSGAGKSTAINCLEDLGYYCIDNIPPALIKDFVSLSKQDKMRIEKAAFVVDIRGGEFFGDLKESLHDLDAAGMKYKVLFLEASNEILIRRFKETRRTHPLATAGNTLDGIEQERERLLEIRKAADFVIDTSTMKAAMLSEEIKKLLLSDMDQANFTISIQSFGYKHGIPLDADMVFDMRFIPNPFYLASMKKLTGNSEKVRNYVMKFEESQKFVETVYQFIDRLIPLYIREGKFHLVVAFGCTGGQHRSVAMANEFTERFLADGKRVVTMHRDL